MILKDEIVEVENLIANADEAGKTDLSIHLETIINILAKL